MRIAFYQRKPGQLEDRTVSIEKYMDMAITDGFSSPRETGLNRGDLSLGVEVLKFASYQTEVLGRAKGLIKIKDDPLLLDDYTLAGDKERERLTALGELEPSIKGKLASFRIAFILKEFEMAKPKRKEMKT